MPRLLSLLLLLLPLVACLEKEMTINVAPMMEDCFFESVKHGEVIDFEYQVIDGGHGDLDITFHLVDPTGRILSSDYKKSENNHRVESTRDGDYKFCFDNRFSSYNSKTVFFELIVEGDEDEESVTGMATEEVYDITVNDIALATVKVKTALAKVRLLQEHIKSNEARDRNIAEENYFKVNTFSWIQMIVMVLVGLVQVLMVRSLFDDNSKVHKLWKSLNSM